MPDTLTASLRGKASVERGKRTELLVATYLRQWWPDAQRRVVTGWRSGQRRSRDLGDITGCDDLVWQVKSTTELSDRQLAEIMARTEDQAVAAAADFGIVVQRRRGHADPGLWWTWLPLADLVHLAGGRGILHHDTAPVRLLLRDTVPLLLRNGYGHAT